MTFLELLDGAEIRNQSGNPKNANPTIVNPRIVNPKISGLEYDSRRIKPGDVFVAIRGESSDGNKFIDQAIAAGAVAVVSDSTDEKPRAGVPWAQISHGRKGLARLAANFYGKPADKLAVTGITGTNGKSTTAFLLEAILAAAGRKSALIGTIEYHVAGEILPAPHTTPESLDLNRLFAEAVSAGATEAVMEVSSHALAQHRVSGIHFAVAVFTNLTRDHLDYHLTMEEYFAAKQLLFKGDDTAPPRSAVINIDDEYGRRLVDISRKISKAILSYGLTQGDFHAAKLEITPQSTKFDLVASGKTLPIYSPLIGRVNVYNILAAAAAAQAGGCKLEEIAQGIGSLTHVPGRFERVDCGQPFTVVVDYAHTDDALRNLTALARELVTRAGPNGRVVTVFGCGGDRDRAKRPLMGEAAGRGSDFVVLTSDNPRSEDPLAIINDAMVGLQRAGAKYRMEPDRKTAIAIAIQEAAPGDIVLLAGKGHEKNQVLREGSIPFDDVEVARQALREAGYDCAVVHVTAGKNP
jgi:UDP-N-acetylmuramoyl-L-alanyl-D-glutamate--2,6-diaminopimelate ligase